MARKKKGADDDSGMPAWMITFGDMMTLLLTFFVLLVSMAKIDERRKLIVLGSIIGTFGFSQQGYDTLTTKNTRRTVEPGPMEEVEDLELLKEMLWEDAKQDLRFESNRFVQILSVNADVLFAPGETRLSAEGRDFLATVLPVLLRVQHPLLIAGHTSTLRDELGEEFKVSDENANPDPSWKISLARTLAVYTYLLDNGMNPDMLKMEAFGRFHPRYPEETPQSRRMNRRVDIVLDKRSTSERSTLDREIRKVRRPEGDYVYEGFVFQLNRTAAPEADMRREINRTVLEAE